MQQYFLQETESGFVGYTEIDQFFNSINQGTTKFNQREFDQINTKT